jgi:hypothetical protein
MPAAFEQACEWRRNENMLAQKQQACHPDACLLPLSRHVCGGAMKTCLLKSSKHATPTHACCLEQACLWRRNENMLAQSSKHATPIAASMPPR